jgi:hypothetical protein
MLNTGPRKDATRSQNSLETAALRADSIFLPTGHDDPVVPSSHDQWEALLRVISKQGAVHISPGEQRLLRVLHSDFALRKSEPRSFRSLCRNADVAETTARQLLIKMDRLFDSRATRWHANPDAQALGFQIVRQFRKEPWTVILEQPAAEKPCIVR